MSIINKVDDRRYEHITTRISNRDISRIKRPNTRRHEEKSKIKQMITNHIYDNMKSYLIVICIFLIGLTIGVIFINHITEENFTQIQEYLNQFIEAVKGDYHIDTGELLKNSLIDNLKLTIAMWFIGSTVVGMPIVLGIVLYRGFCIGYTISSAIMVLGSQRGIIFSLATMLLQNILFIPILLVLAVSGIRLYKSIMKDKRKENIKLEIIRHTAYSLIAFVLLIVVSFIEVYISSNLLTMIVQFL